MNERLTSGKQYALLRTFKVCIENGGYVANLAKTLDDFIEAFDLNKEEAACLQQLKKNLEDAKPLTELFTDCEAFDKPVRFFLSLPAAVNVGRWETSFDLALEYLNRFLVK